MWWLEIAPESSAERAIRHRFCGAPRSGTPPCPNCRRPLLVYAELDACDERLGAAPTRAQPASLDLPVRPERWPLLFCWRCNVAQQPFHYALDEAGGVRLVSFGTGGVEEDFPYASYPEAFPPGELALRAVDPEDAALLAAYYRGAVDTATFGVDQPHLAEPRHQLGGSPLFAPRLERLACARCGERMAFLAAFGDGCLDRRGFTGNPFVQVLFDVCRTCRAIGVRQICD